MLLDPTRSSLADTDDAIRATRAIILHSSTYTDMSQGERAFLDCQLFNVCKINRETPSSILSSRRMAASALQATVQLYFNDLLDRCSEPYLVTFAFRLGEVPMGHKLLYVQTLISMAVDALSEFELEGLLTTDVDLLLPIGSQEPVSAFHLHGIVVSTRSSKRKLRLKHTAKEMNRGIGLESRLPSGVGLDGKLEGDFRWHVERMATYAGKYTAALKVESVRPDGTSRYARDRSFYTARHAINHLYAWSQIPVLKSVIPVGAIGEELHGVWRRKMTKGVGLSVPQFVGSPADFNSAEAERLWPDILSKINRG